MGQSARLVIASAFAVLAGTAAVAHPKLIASIPAVDASVAAPAFVKLRFNEAVVSRFSGVAVQMTTMPGMTMKTPMMMATRPAVSGDNGTSLTIKLAKPLSKGSYKVAWHAVAADTHRVAGSYTFTVK